jgi:MOSC domain-containing protein YiiM
LSEITRTAQIRREEISFRRQHPTRAEIFALPTVRHGHPYNGPPPTAQIRREEISFRKQHPTRAEIFALPAVRHGHPYNGPPPTAQIRREEISFRRQHPNRAEIFALPWVIATSVQPAYPFLVPEFEITRLYVSPGHNFFGHERNKPSSNPAFEVSSVWCVAGKGIEGDRFFDHKDSYKGQITFFEEETYDDLCVQLGIWDRSPSVFRRNVLTRGVKLNDLIGREFAIGDVHLLGTEESRPCFWMDGAFGPGAQVALKGRGGLRARILTTGRLALTRQGSGAADFARSKSNQFRTSLDSIQN